MGWLTKAVDAARLDPFVFASERAPVTLGVGKNMVRAIRFWGLAMKVIAEDHQSRGRIAPIRPTRLGMALLGPDGWDRYLEDPHSVWLLHWMLLRPPVRTPVWWWAFTGFEPVEFSDRHLEAYCLEQAAGLPTGAPASSSITKDVDCLLRMYGRREGAGHEWLDSPFAALRLLEQVPGGNGRWRFASPVPVSPDPRLVGYVCIDALLSWEPTGRTVSIGRLAAAPDGPGRLLRQSEADLADALSRLGEVDSGISVVAPAGFNQLAIDGDPRQTAARLLDSLYGGAGRVMATPETLRELLDVA
jgi:hypothetical protein